MDTSFKKELKAKAHHLKPVVLLGNKGLNPAVIAEIDVALIAHELIKVKLTGVEKVDKHGVAESLAAQVQGELIQVIGHVAVLYRKRQED